MTWDNSGHQVGTAGLILERPDVPVDTARTQERATPRVAPGNRAVSWLILAVPVAMVLAGAWRYHWVQEDAFIDIRVIDNLLAGHGPVYNVGERVKVYSDPLWLYLVAVVHAALPFVSVEWDEVVLGLVATGSGVALAGRATQRLGGSLGEGLVLPLGLVVFAAVGAVWEFATSGLEMGLVFLWIGASLWLTVRTRERRSSGLGCASVIGLGTLIRPELALMSIVFLVTLGVVEVARIHEERDGTRRRGRTVGRLLGLVGTAVALPLAYEVFRMGYFAMVVPNTALAKSASGTSWAEGASYLWNFLAPYTLWLPLALAVVLMLPLMAGWWRGGHRVEVAIALCPLVAGLVDVLYVVKVGGDYMHARLLLPGFCAFCAGVFLPVRRLRYRHVVLPVVVIVAWAVVCAGWLRVPPGTSTHGVGDERDAWVGLAGKPHPMVPGDLDRIFTWRWARHFNQLAAEPSAGQRMQLGVAVVPAGSPLPFRLAVGISVSGIFGVVAGPKVYVFDTNSLSNPIGSHTETLNGRQGKTISVAWMAARFGRAGELPDSPAAAPGSVTAARRALGCDPLHAYLLAITAPVGVGRFWSNVVHSLGYTTMSFGADPDDAARQLCRP
jgi:arabinofuranosyltransferase